MKATIVLIGEEKKRAYEMYLRMRALWESWQTVLTQNRATADTEKEVTKT